MIGVPRPYFWRFFFSEHGVFGPGDFLFSMATVDHFINLQVMEGVDCE